MSGGRARSGAWLILVAAALWSTNGVAIKYIELGPVAIAAGRALVAGLVMVPFFKWDEVRLSRGLIGLVLSYAFLSGTFVSATKLTAAANAIALQYTAPLWIFAAGLVTGRVHLTARRAAPMFLVVLGIGSFLMEPVKGTSMIGNALALVSGIGFAAVTVYLRRMRGSHGPTMIGLANLASSLVLLPFISGWGRFGDLSVSGWLCLGYLGAFQMGGGYIFYAKGLKKVSALKAATVALLEPVLNPVWVLLFIGEAPSGFGVAGAAAILSGVLLDLRLNPVRDDDAA